MEPEEYCIIMKKKPAFLWENIIAGKKEKDGYIFLFTQRIGDLYITEKLEL